MSKFYAFLLSTTFAVGMLFSGLAEAGGCCFGLGNFFGCGYRPACVRPVYVRYYQPVRCYYPVRYYTVRCRWVPGYRTCDGCVTPGHRVCWKTLI